MALIPDAPNDSVSLIYRAYEAQEDSTRFHLGASSIGKACNREIWYSFRWADNPKETGRMRRLFRRGHEAEAVFADELRMIGVTVHTVDERRVTPDNPAPQFQIFTFAGLFGGSMDGCAIGIPEAPKRWHVVEFKTHNNAQFKQLQKLGVKGAHYKHWVQCQIYMGFTGMHRTFYMGENKETSELYKERIHFEPKVFKALVDKAYMIIFSPGIPGRISEDPHSRDCQHCDYQFQCHYGTELAKNCRTCTSVRISTDGNWYCAKAQAQGWLEPLTKELQLTGCNEWEMIKSC